MSGKGIFHIFRESLTTYRHDGGSLHNSSLLDNRSNFMCRWYNFWDVDTSNNTTTDGLFGSHLEGTSFTDTIAGRVCIN